MAVQLGKYAKNGLSVNFIVYKLYQVKKKMTLCLPPPPPPNASILRKHKIFKPQKEKKTKKTLLLKLYNSFG